jgi:LCP family protein required for cell wall assembly
MAGQLTPAASSPRAATADVGRHRAAGATALRSGRSLRSTLGLTALAVVLPGGSMWLLGRRKLGGALVVAYLALLGTLTYVAVAHRPTVLRLSVQPRWLNAVIAGLVAGFVIWALVVVISHMMARPRGLRRGQRLLATAFVVALCCVLAVPFAVAVRYASAQKGFINHVFSGTTLSATTPDDATVADPWRGQERVNVLLLGSDAGPEREGIRTDSMIVASVDVSSGNVVLFSLPRNLENVPFPEGTELDRLYPNGFTGEGDPLEWMLNTVYSKVPELHPEVLGKSDNEGADALKMAVSGALGIPVDYYVMVNISGFVQLVDAMGGVTVNVNERIPIGGVTGVRLPEDYIEPGPDKHLDGYHALWFARGRYGLDDYDRMRRQRCLMAAVIDRANPMTLLTRYDRILEAGREIVQTDIPGHLLPAFVDLGFEVKDAKIRSVVFERSDEFSPEAPDYEWLHQQVRAAIEKSESTGGAGGNGGGSGGGKDKSLAQAPEDACAYDPEPAG